MFWKELMESLQILYKFLDVINAEAASYFYRQNVVLVLHQHIHFHRVAITNNLYSLANSMDRNTPIEKQRFAGRSHHIFHKQPPFAAQGSELLVQLTVRFRPQYEDKS